MFGKLHGITERFIGFVSEMDRGIVVGRGYEPVEKNTAGVRRTSQIRRGVRQDAGCGRRASGGRIRYHWAGRRDASGRS